MIEDLVTGKRKKTGTIWSEWGRERILREYKADVGAKKSKPIKNIILIGDFT